MRRYVTAVTLVLAVGGLGAMPSNAAPDKTYQKYAQVRDKMKGCALDAQSGALGTERRKECKKLKKNYTLYGRFGIPGTTFIRCKKRKPCPKAPIGVPNPRGPIIPRAVRIYG